MSDQYEIQDLTGTVSLGVLAENVVLALGRALRSEPMRDQEIQALRDGRDVLRSVISDVPRLTTIGWRGMTSEVADRELSRAIRLQAPDESARDRINRLVSSLDRASTGAVAAEDLGDLRSAQGLFALVGEITLTRTNELFEGSHREQFAWTDMSTRSPF